MAVWQRSDQQKTENRTVFQMREKTSVCLSDERTPASPSGRQGASSYQETLSKEWVEIPRAEEGGGVGQGGAR